MKILIVDDDPRQGEALSDLLASRGHEPFVAADDGEAEWLSGLFRFEMAVIDFDLRGTTGLEVARRLRRTIPDVQPVIVSGHAIESIGREVLGDLPFFSKPIDHAALLSFVELTVTRRCGAFLVPRRDYPLGPPAKP